MHFSAYSFCVSIGKLKPISKKSYIYLLAVATAISVQSQPVNAQVPKQPSKLPTVFNDGRFFLQPITIDGVTLNLLTGTGGDGALLSRDFVRRVHWPKALIPVNGKLQEVTSLHELRPTSSIPMQQINNGRFLVVPELKSPCGREIDGFLGQSWFAGQVVTFDYPGHQMLLKHDLNPIDPRHLVALGFRSDAAGKRTHNFPRISVEVDGQALDLLLDTGATVCLNFAALQQLADGGSAERATSMISQSIFDLWRRIHPEWRVIDQAETVDDHTFGMILVPRITVGGYTVGPVWFTSRDASHFRQLTQSMDKPVVGSLGGTALQYLRVSIDYPNGSAAFERP